jgi:hypothetical protein
MPDAPRPARSWRVFDLPVGGTDTYGFHHTDAHRTDQYFRTVVSFRAPPPPPPTTMPQATESVHRWSQSPYGHYRHEQLANQSLANNHSARVHTATGPHRIPRHIVPIPAGGEEVVVREATDCLLAYERDGASAADGLGPILSAIVTPSAGVLTEDLRLQFARRLSLIVSTIIWEMHEARRQLSVRSRGSQLEHVTSLARLIHQMARRAGDVADRQAEKAYAAGRFHSLEAARQHYAGCEADTQRFHMQNVERMLQQIDRAQVEAAATTARQILADSEEEPAF